MSSARRTTCIPNLSASRLPGAVAAFTDDGRLGNDGISLVIESDDYGLYYHPAALTVRTLHCIPAFARY